jgi:dolichol-phosphate mannosyltransferase
MPFQVRTLAEWEAAGVPGMLSVVIPAHNEEGQIAETVRGLADALRDAGISYEILVVNDNSSDATECILASMSTADIGLRYINTLSAATGTQCCQTLGRTAKKASLRCASRR